MVGVQEAVMRQTLLMAQLIQVEVGVVQDLTPVSKLEAMELTAPESASPDFTGWTHSFVRAANMLKVLPAAAKPKWWSPHGLKERCGLVLANPQGYAPDSSLMSPAWQITGHAFEMENNNDEAAKAYDTAAGYEMDRERCNALQRRDERKRLGILGVPRRMHPGLP